MMKQGFFLKKKKKVKQKMERMENSGRKSQTPPKAMMGARLGAEVQLEVKVQLRVMWTNPSSMTE
jgi:hypothetical protein